MPSPGITSAQSKMPKKSLGRPYNLFQKTHVKKAIENIAVRDQPYWTKYYNADLGRFVRKTGKITIGNRQVKASDLYASAYESGSLKVPFGYNFKMSTGRLIEEKRPKKNQTLSAGIIFDNDTREVFRNLEAGELVSIKPGTYTITAEFYGRPDTSKDSHSAKGVKSHFRGDGSRHKHLEVFGKKTVMGGERVVLSMLYKPCTFNVTHDKFLKFLRVPKRERVYINQLNLRTGDHMTLYGGQDDFYDFYQMIPADCPNKPKSPSSIDVIKITQVCRVGDPSGCNMRDQPLAAFTVPQILSHEYIHLKVKRNESPLAAFDSPAPFCRDDNCVLVNLAIFSKDDFKRHYSLDINEQWLHRFFKNVFNAHVKQQITTTQLKAFFRHYRLKFTVLNVAGVVIDHYTPEMDGKTRNKDFRNVHLYFVQHNTHMYTLTKNKMSFERKPFPDTLAEVKQPKPWSHVPPQTGYDMFAGSIHDINNCLKKVSEISTTDGKLAKVRVSYSGESVESVFHWLRHAHSVEAEIVSFTGHIAAFKLTLENCEFIVCETQMTRHPETMNEWLNRFKRAMFHPEYKSVYCESVRHAFTKYRKAQLWTRFEEYAPAECQGIDITRFYVKAGLMMEKLPVFLYTDEFLTYGGEAIEDYNLYVVENFDPTDVKRFIVADREHSLITGYTLRRCGFEFRILYVLQPSHLARNPFRDLVQSLMEADVPDEVKKSVPLICIGIMGKMVNQNTKGYFTLNRDEAQSLVNPSGGGYDMERNYVMAADAGGYFAVRRSEPVVVEEGWYPFQMWVYCLARLQLLNLYKLVEGKAKVYGVLTDNLFVESIPDSVPLHDKTNGTSFEDIGKYHREKAKKTPQTMMRLHPSPNLIEPAAAYKFTRVTDKDGTPWA